MTNPRSKGKRGEYKVRDALTLWTGKEFNRTPSSGAFGTINKIHEFVGDLVCEDPDFPFCVEVKNHEGWELGQLLTSSNPQILQWWGQATIQATKSGKYPMLVILRNRAKPLVVVDASFYLAVSIPKKVSCIAYVSLKHHLHVYQLQDVTTFGTFRA